MARTDTLGHFLTDVADSIRTKTGSETTITASEFDTAIGNIPTGGGNLQIKTVNITSNGTQTITPDTGYDALESVEVNTNVAIDMSEYFYDTIYTWMTNGWKRMIKKLPTTELTVNSNRYDLNSFFASCPISELPSINLNNVTSMVQTFESSYIITAPTMDTSKVTGMTGLFQNCTRLVNVPLYNTSRVTSMQSMFKYCTRLSEESLNNILAMCSSSAQTSNKTLKYVFGNDNMSATYPAATIQSLSNYSAFTSAGWTIGW